MATTHVGLFEAKTHFSELVARAERGEAVIITRHNKPVARIVPIDDAPAVDTAKRYRALADLQAIGARMIERGGPITVDEILEWRDEGRR